MVSLKCLGCTRGWNAPSRLGEGVWLCLISPQILDIWGVPQSLWVFVPLCSSEFPAAGDGPELLGKVFLLCLKGFLGSHWDPTETEWVE